MRKFYLLMPQFMALALSATARANLPVAPTVLLAANTMPATSPKVSGTNAGSGAAGLQGDIVTPSDWSAPPQPQLDGPEENDTAPRPKSALPTLEMRPAADSSATDAAADTDQGPRVDLGGPGTPKWKVVVYVTQTTQADDNINISHSHKQGDVSFSAAPGVAVGWGDFATELKKRGLQFADEYQQTNLVEPDPLTGDFVYLNYTADATHYYTHDELDAVDQNAELNGQWDFTKTLVTLDARVQTLSGPDIDLGQRARRTLYSFDAAAVYTASDKTTFNLDAGGNVSQYSSALDSSDWHAQLFMDYQAMPKTKIGAGIVAGLRELQTSPNQYYQQAQLRATYNYSDKLSVHVNGGLEIDEATGGGSNQLNPVFGLGLVYNLNETDALTLDASRSTSSSAVTTGETVETTTVDFGLNHRLFTRFSLQLNGGYTHSDYFNQGLSTHVRTDDYVFVKPSVAYDLSEWCQIALAYEYHRDVSTDLPFDFAENIASLQFNFVF